MRKILIKDCLIVQLIGGIISLLLVLLVSDNDTIYSSIFVCYYLLCLGIIWYGLNKKITPFFLFLLTFGLFIGGHFFSHLMGFEGIVFEIDYFVNEVLEESAKRNLMVYVIGFLVFSVTGYLSQQRTSIKSFKTNLIQQQEVGVSRILRFLFYLITPVLLYNNIQNLQKVISHGYMVLFSKQAEIYTSYNFSVVIFRSLFGLALVYGSKTEKKLYFSMFCLDAIFSIMMGGRGKLGSLFLIVIWMYSLQKKISLKRIIAYCGISLTLLLVIFSYSFRVLDKNNLAMSPSGIILDFIYGQGVTLMIVNESMSIPEYPPIPYVNSLFPGIAFITSYFRNTPYQVYEVDFASWLAYQLNANLFLKGFGTGWSVLSDFYLYGGRTFIGFFILSFFFGFLLRRLELASEHSKRLKGLIYTIIYPLLILPRAGLNSICPLIVYYLIFHFLILHYAYPNKR